MKGSRSFLAVIVFFCALGASASLIEVWCQGGVLRVTVPKKLAEQAKAQVLAFLEQDCEVGDADAAHDDRVVFEFRCNRLSSEDEQAFALRLKTLLDKNVNDCCCGVCEFYATCCVCEDVDFISSCATCTPKAKEPERRVEAEEAAMVEMPPPPKLVPRDIVTMPRLSLTLLHRRASPSPRSPNRSPKLASPQSNKSSPNSPRTPRLFMSWPSSDAEIDESN